MEVRILSSGDAAVLEQLAPGVFDRPINPVWCREFLNDPRHHLAVALDGPLVMGMATAVSYANPDKPPELWINEVGVSPAHRRRGVARELLRALLARGRALGCIQAWVLTSEGNAAARALYAGAGGRASSEPSIMYEFPLNHVP